MRNDEILDLNEHNEVDQTLRSRPPRLIRWTALILISLLGTGVIWSATSEADLIVKAQGRIRPIT